ncbi:MAG TPA: hypothetical protein VF815_38065 [Myxococcaceae bacterium]|jgi:hypothetical protein
MSKHIVSVAAALLGAGALVAACDLKQPEAGCIVQDTDWYAKYDLKPDSADPAGCEAPELISEKLGVYKFTNPDQPGQTKLTIRPYGLASRGTRDPSDPALQTAMGDLSDEPVESFCAATNFVEASVDAAAQADNEETAWDETEGAVKIAYTFENVEVYSAPRAPGTQLKGELTYTVNGCTRKYGVRAMWPAASCDPAEAGSCGSGSGVNPDFRTECAPNPLYDEAAAEAAEGGEDVPEELTAKGYCVPVGEIPAFEDEE